MAGAGTGAAGAGTGTGGRDVGTDGVLGATFDGGTAAGDRDCKDPAGKHPVAPGGSAGQSGFNCGAPPRPPRLPPRLSTACTTQLASTTAPMRKARGGLSSTWIKATPAELVEPS